MNYLTNEDGEVALRRKSGDIIYLPKHLAEDQFLLTRQELEIVEAAIPFEPKIKKEKTEK